MSPRVALTATALAVTASLFAPATANAERWAGGDAEGDVAGWFVEPEPAPCGTATAVDASANTNDDITRLVVSHQRKVVRVVVRFRDLDPQQGQHVGIHLTAGRPEWLLDVRRFRDFDSDIFQVSSFLGREPAEPDDGSDGCGEVVIVPTGCHVRPRIDLSANTISAEVPRSCLRHPRWVRVGARTSGGGAPAPSEGARLVYADDWGPGAGSGWHPAYGPKVRAPRGARLGPR